MVKTNIMRLYQWLLRVFGGHDLTRFRVVRWADDGFKRWIYRSGVWVEGNRMVLDDKDSLCLGNFRYEAFQTDLTRFLVRPGQTVVDVGAMIGYYTLICARRVGSRGRVFAFEPDPDNFEILRRNIKINGLSNVVSEQFAASDRSGPSQLYRSWDNNGDHRSFDVGDGRKVVEVQAIELDEYFRERADLVDLVKLDVQGHEWAVVRGMSSLLKRNEQVLVMTEYSPLLLTQSGFGHEEYLRLLTGMGFALYEIDEGAAQVRPVSVQELLDRYPASSEDYTNLLCSRQPIEFPQGWRKALDEEDGG